MKIYTKTGDKGQTSLFDGTRVEKDSLRVEAYGTLDELNSFVGLASLAVEDMSVRSALTDIQKTLFFAAGQLATVKKDKYKYSIREKDVEALESVIDTYLSKIEHINAFIVPGTSEAAARLHVARTVCRRAERCMLTLSRQEEVEGTLMRFVNRLSDALYTLARYSEANINIMNFDEEYEH